MPRVAVLPPPTHDEQKEQSSQMRDEYAAAKKHAAIPSKAIGRKMMKAAMKEERESAEHEYEAGDRVKMRQQILALRLFPNLFNRAFLMKAAGPN